MLLKLVGRTVLAANENREVLQAVYWSKPAGDRHVAYTMAGIQNKRDHLVLETVLNSNKFSQKQLDIIVSEIVKHENLTLNF